MIVKRWLAPFALMAALAVAGFAAPAHAAPVELRYATGGFFPTGTGSVSYIGNFYIVVDNLAFAKVVSVWGQQAEAGPWAQINGTFQASLPDNKELWLVKVNAAQLHFAVKYTVNGTTHWDNNGGLNYHMFPASDDLTIGVPQVVGGPASFPTPAASTFAVPVAVRNLGFSKIVGIRYTTDNWATSTEVTGFFGRTSSPAVGGAASTETWNISAVVGSAAHIQYAVFYKVNGQTYWDNNFGQNYRLDR